MNVAEVFCCPDRMLLMQSFNRFAILSPWGSVDWLTLRAGHEIDGDCDKGARIESRTSLPFALIDPEGKKTRTHNTQKISEKVFTTRCACCFFLMTLTPHFDKIFFIFGASFSFVAANRCPDIQ